MNININLEQIKQSFNEKTLARGITYYNDKRVQSIAFDAAESQYNSRVAGQGKSIYSTILFVKNKRRSTLWMPGSYYHCLNDPV